MANSPALLDTSVIIRHFRRDQSVTAQMDAAEALFLPAVVLGELYHGAFRGRQREKELRCEDNGVRYRQMTFSALQTYPSRQPHLTAP